MTESIDVPQDAIPYQSQSGWHDSGESIMRMRWENRELIDQLWAALAHRTTRTFNGKPYLVRETYVSGKVTQPPINAEGAKAVINVVLSVVNTVGSLSKIHQEHAMVLVRQSWIEIEDMLILNQDVFECYGRDKINMVLGIVNRIVFLQLMRAVQGHESQQSRTNLVEKRGEESYTMESKGGGMKFPWSRRNE